MGIVGVTSFSVLTKGELDVDQWGLAAGSRRGAEKGAAEGAFFGFAGLPYTIIVGGPIGSTIAGGIAGAGIGAILADPALPDEEAHEIKTQLKAVLTDIGKQETLRSTVVQVAAQLGVLNLKEITVETATEPSNSVNSQMAAEFGIDTVLKVGLAQVGLVGRQGEYPQLSLYVHAVARLVDIRTNADLYRNDSFTYMTSPRSIREWIADDAFVFKRELGRAYKSVATSMVDEIFLVVRSN